MLSLVLSFDFPQIVDLGLTMDYVPKESRPDWYFKLHTYLFHSIYISYINIFGEQAIDQLRQIREGLGLEMFDNFEHSINSYPSISLGGQSLSSLSNHYFNQKPFKFLMPIQCNFSLF